MILYETNKICLLIESSDEIFSKTRLSIKSFVSNNKWFKGDIFVLTNSGDNLNEHNEKILKNDHDDNRDIKIIFRESDDYYSNEDGLRLNAFNIKSNGLIYLSRKSLVLKNIESCVNEDHIISYGEEMKAEYDLNKINSNFMFIPKKYLTGSFSEFITGDYSEELNINDYLTNKLVGIRASIQQKFIVTESLKYPDHNFGTFIRYNKVISIIIFNNDFSRYRRMSSYWISMNKKYLMPVPPSKVNINKEKFHHKNKNVDHSDYPITIITPAYKASKYIRECLDSIFNQDCGCEYEILIGIDNCDSTKDYLKSVDFGPRVKCYLSRELVGPYVIRNSLINIAKYENILFFDADDIMMPNMISTLLEYYNKVNPIRSMYYNFNDGDDYLKRHTPHRTHAHGVFFTHKNILTKVGGFKDWKCGADTEFMKRCEKNRIKDINIQDRLFYRRIHGNSLTQNRDTGFKSEIRTIASRYIKMNTDWSIPIEMIETELIRL